VEQEPRAQRPWRAARVGRTPARLEEHMDRFEASLRETQETLQALQRARVKDCAVLDWLCEHLMGPLDFRDYGIHSSSFSRG
jgi:primosomal protein N''